MVNKPHTSVLLHEILEAFSCLKMEAFVDCTLGAGGHAEAILKAHPELKCYVGIDQDPTAREIASKRLEPWKNKLQLIPGNFRDFQRHLDSLNLDKVDGILLDLGVSSMQLDKPEKGFSFMQEGPLDMRMDPENPLTAEEIVNTWSEQELGRIFREFGEEKQWKSSARAIVASRLRQPIRTTKELAAVLMPILGWKAAKKGINPVTLVFQALRLAVNGELEALEKILPQALLRLNSKGRLAVISFHSLEDRIAKQLFQYEASDKENTSGLAGLFLDKKPTIRIITKKPIIPGETEVDANPRSRSAKLRVAEKI
jgi:16S rRNA (cytosine1402-N4)-methyltransferase